MKQTLQCPKCQSRTIGFFDCVHDKAAGGPLKRVLTSRTSGIPIMGTQRTVAAYVEAYVCTACGYFEEYVTEPESVPWEELPSFRWCRPEVPETPYR